MFEYTDKKSYGDDKEMTIGNSGPDVAFVAGVKGYRVELFLPAQLSSSYNPADRIRIAKLFGC